LTWETKPLVTLDASTYESTQGEWTAFDVGAYVREVTAGAAADYGLVLHADGAGRDHWKRFVAESGLDGGALEPRLVVHWSILRPSVVSATRGSDEVALAWSNPALAPATSQIQIQISDDGFATVSKQLRLRADSALSGSAALPIGDLVNGTYSWRLRAKYGAGAKWSAWSDAGSFGIGAAAQSEVYHQPAWLTF
jgi:hypothetical protein